MTSDGRVVIASISGGKDSAAMSLHLRDRGIEHERVFCDTGWEHQATYDYLRGHLTAAIGPITEIKAPLGFADLVRRKGMFPSRTRRFCTQELKVFPLQRYIRSRQDEIGDVVNAVGIRRAESRARAAMTEWEWSDGFDCDIWRPLISWTEADVIDIHRRHGLPPNPLYLQGSARVGCWPCIHARKSEIRHLAEKDPARIDLIRELEAEAEEKARLRYEAKGETFESLGFNRPRFFQAPGALRNEGRDGRMVGIDQVVAWAQTGRGGHQYEIFADMEEPGCVRWGLCDGRVVDG